MSPEVTANLFQLVIELGVRDSAQLGVKPKPTRFDSLRDRDEVELVYQAAIPQQTFGSIIAELRKPVKLSQRELALATGMNHSSISRLEGRGSIPSISNVLSLVEVLKPDKHQTLRLIVSLANERDRTYINDLLGLSGISSNPLVIRNLDTSVSTALTPVGKAREYRKRRPGGEEGRTIRQVGKIGGIDHTSVSRFFSGKRDISGSCFVPLVRGLGLTRREQVVDFFYSFGFQAQRNGKVVTQTLEQKAS